MLLIIYLDDIPPTAPTAELWIAQGKLLMKLLQDLGFLMNMNKSVLTPTQRIIFLGFVIDSINMTILSQRKTICNNSDGQLIVRSKFGLYFKLVSVCGHVFSDTPTTEASSFVLQKSSTINKHSIK